MKYLKNNTFFIFVILIAFIAGGITSTSIIYRLLFYTEYSDDFSKRAWRKLEIGMSELQVKSIIGEPLFEYQWPDENKITLHYSKSSSISDSYVHYYLVVQKGKVIVKEKEHYVD